MNGPTQTRWHVLTECADVHLIEPRRKAAEWLSNKLNQFGREAQWTLAAISGAGNQLQPEQRMAALRFLLGLPNVVIPDCRDGESKLAQGYGKGFLKWIAVIIRTACFVQPRPTWLRWRRRQLSPARLCRRSSPCVPLRGCACLRPSRPSSGCERFAFPLAHVPWRRSPPCLPCPPAG